MTYLDYQATTPLAPEALDAMLPWLRDGHANPHSAHREGRRARAAVEVAREQVLAMIDPDGEDRGAGRLFFTGGATEALNWAIRGTWERLGSSRPRVVTIATEHACVLDSIAALAPLGAQVVVLPVDGDGQVDRAAALAAIDDRTALVAAMLVNNEIGTIGDVAWLGEAAARAGATMICDAVQGVGRVPLPLSACDLVAVSAHKIYGPKGIGALWARGGHEPAALLHGGGQEGGLRSGTLSPALCAGFGTAATLMANQGNGDVEAMWAAARGALTDWSLNGDPVRRWRGNLNVRRPGLDVARLMSDLRDLSFSAGSACASGSGRPSHVLRAIGLTDAAARGSIRLGYGRYTDPAALAEAAARIDATARAQGA